MVKTFTIEQYGEFQVETKVTFLKRNEIENIVARIYGGRSEAIDERLKLEQQHMKLSKVDDKTTHIVDFVKYNEQQTTLLQIQHFATLKVMLVNSPVDIDELDTPDIDIIYTEYEKVLQESVHTPTIEDSGRYQKLLQEFSNVNFRKKKIELSEELSEMYSEIFLPENQWRHHYNISLTDPRYLEADRETICKDLLLIQLRAFYEKYEMRNPVRKRGSAQNEITTEEDLQKEFEDVAKRIKNNRNNYVSEEEVEAYMAEKVAKEFEYKLMGLGLDEETLQELYRAKMATKHNPEIREQYQHFLQVNEKELEAKAAYIKSLRQKDKVED
jgi:hypothetical protein